jgi:predicted nuclease of restriction endonuclease-like (RecB) superfamily
MLDTITGYPALLKEIKERIRSAQYEALKAVNKELISLYWDIGRIIVENQKGASWGKSVVERLSADLQTELLGISGFSPRNIWRMRDFYLVYRNNPKLSPLVSEIGWTHNLIILNSCGTDLEREFYIRMTIKHGWSKRTLFDKIELKTYETTMASQTSFEKALPPELAAPARLAVKDEYTFDFLEMGDERTERRLECAILTKVEPFLREMGGLFSFVGSQYRIEVGDQEYFIDLMLYHRSLKCLVAVELKTGNFLPEHVGKMQFYLAALDDLEREEGENPSIGIILCRSKNRITVEYALRESRKPIGVSVYRLVRKLPAKLRRLLPDRRQVEMLLGPGDRPESGIASREMREYPRKLRELDRIARKSKMTPEDAARIGKKVKKAIHGHYKKIR